VENSSIISELSSEIGCQSVVAVLDIKKKRLSSGYDVYTRNGKKKHKLNLLHFIESLQQQGVGEIVINSIDNDGVMKGYDHKLISMTKKYTQVPLTVLGGAGHLDDLSDLFSKYGVLGAAAGSLFVFKGKFRAVLISYPSGKEKEKLFDRAFDLAAH
jgi:imidazole glycerol-phosphate synthase subunit HisF